ncbi:MAG: hypothetical protein ABI847_01215 [Anaerolineales bacterium]
MNPLPPARRSPRDSAGYIPWWLLLIVAALFVIAALILAGLALATRNNTLPRATATVVIVTAPPAQQTSAPTATIQSPPTLPPEAPTVTAPPPPPGEVKTGAYVQVVGTGDAGFLNLRAEPNLDSAVNYLALEHEVFQVQAGPTDASGFAWWYLVDPATNTRFGWAVQNYLQVVQAP